MEGNILLKYKVPLYSLSNLRDNQGSRLLKYSIIDSNLLLLSPNKLVNNSLESSEFINFLNFSNESGITLFIELSNTKTYS